MGAIRITIPEGQEPLPYLMTQIGSSELRGVLQSMGLTAFFNDSAVTPREREAGRFYLASLVDCAVCEQNRPARDLVGYSATDIEDAFYEHVFEWRTWPGYTERERLVIELYEAFLFDHLALAADDDLWARLAVAFDPTEIEDLCLLATIGSAINRLREVLLGGQAVCRPAAAGARR